MKKSCLFSLAIAALAASSCSTVSHEATVAKVDNKIVSMTVGDLNVSKQKASATAEWKWTPFNAVKPSEISLAATAKLLKENNADVVIEPTTEIKRRGLFRGGSVTVTGYPATYTGFHPMTEQEATAYAATRLCPTATATVAPLAPAAKFAKPSVKVSKERKPFNNGSFLTASIGVTNIPDYYDDADSKTGGSFGLTYGHYCKNRWGWYVRGTLDWGAGYDDTYTHRNRETGEECSSAHRNYGGALTAGVLFGCSNKFGLFLGTGFGGTPLRYDRDNTYNVIDNCGTEAQTRYGEVRPIIPVELGINLRFDALNLMAGYRCSFCTDDIEICPSSTFFLGVGINF